MQEFGPSQRLTAAHAEALWRRWSERKDSRARDELVLAYSQMVRYLATRKVRELPAHCELDDLVSSGILALIEAIDRFDPRKGATFEQYAWTRIAGSIVDELRRQDWASRSVRRTGKKIEQARERLYARNGAQPSETELAAEMKVSPDELRASIESFDRADVASLNAPARASEDAFAVEVVETLASRSADFDPQESTLTRERRTRLRAVIAALPERERDVLALIHIHELPGAEVGRMLGVSESRISQILSSARGKLRAELAGYDETQLAV
jgi:RNA polymerase sigma factor for flagellar operon FliA